MSSQKLVIPGDLKSTRKMARQHITGYEKNPRGKLTGYEEHWNDKRLKELPEYDG